MLRTALSVGLAVETAQVAYDEKVGCIRLIVGVVALGLQFSTGTSSVDVEAADKKLKFELKGNLKHCIGPVEPCLTCRRFCLQSLYSDDSGCLSSPLEGFDVMTRTRREALKTALLGALIVAAPVSTTLAQRVRRRRYVLKDGSIIEVTSRGVYRIRGGRRRRVESGRFILKDGRALDVLPGGGAEGNFVKAGPPTWVKFIPDKPGSIRRQKK